MAIINNAFLLVILGLTASLLIGLVVVKGTKKFITVWGKSYNRIQSLDLVMKLHRSFNAVAVIIWIIIFILLISSATARKLFIPDLIILFSK